MIKYIFLTCFSLIASSALAGNGYYYPAYNANKITVVEQHIVSPVRVVRFREIKGLRFVTDQYGQQLVLVGDKVLNIAGGKTESVTEEVRGTRTTERIITRRDYYGNQTVTIEKEVTK